MSTAYDLYLDESGQFLETSTDAREAALAPKDAKPFASQLAGLLVRRDGLMNGEALRSQRRVLAAAGMTDWPHARDVARGPGYDALVMRATEEFGRRGWQPVRLVNREQVRFGDRVATYANLLAELVLRACQQKARGDQSVALRLFPGRVAPPGGGPGHIDREEILRRVRESLAYVAVRRGLARESALWRVDELELRGGGDPAIGLCDLISNASHADFGKLGPDARRALETAFGGYDFSLHLRELLERVEAHVADGAYGLALIALTERLAAGGGQPPDERSRLADLVARLAAMPAPARDLYLREVAGWLEQIVEGRRDVERGFRVARWLASEVERPLSAALRAGDRPGLAWFAYALHTQALSASNHRGALGDARRAVAALADLLPTLAGHWEHAPLLMKGLIHEAVHRTDSFDHDGASARVRAVAAYYGSLAALFCDAMPEVFPTRVRSELHGQALGTWMQSEMYSGLADPARLAEARRLSDLAIDEFPAREDKERQYQLRSQLEAAAGRWDEARRYLAEGVGAPGATHAELGRVAADLGGFPLLHWLRLGVNAWLAGPGQEADDFAAAYREQAGRVRDWLDGDAAAHYPAHGVLRRVAVAQALGGDAAAAAGTLRRLGGLCGPNAADRLVLLAVRMAAHAEAAAVLLPCHAKAASRMLECADAERPGLRQQLVQFGAKARDEFPAAWAEFAPWEVAVAAALAGDAAGPAALLRLARRVGY